MWWLFKKLFEDEDEIEYAFSRETRTLAGRIRFKKTSMEVISATREDGDNERAFEVAVSWARSIILKEGAPDERLVACG